MLAVEYMHGERCNAYLHKITQHTSHNETAVSIGLTLNMCLHAWTIVNEDTPAPSVHGLSKVYG